MCVIVSVVEGAVIGGAGEGEQVAGWLHCLGQHWSVLLHTLF